MSSKTIEEIALDLSNELEDVYFAELTKALYQYNDFEIMTGIGEEGVNKPDPTIEDKLHAVSSELKNHSERFTVALIKRLLEQGFLISAEPKG